MLLEYVSDARVAVVTLNRPHADNAITTELAASLIDVLETIAARPSVRCAVLTGAGDRAFSVGGDLYQRKEMTKEQWLRQRQVFDRVLYTLRELRRPVIAAVNGMAYGGGCEMAISADFIIASDDASFGQPEAIVGLSAGGGAPIFLPRALPPGMALQMLMTGDPITAREAHRLGLVNEIHPRADLLTAVLRHRGEDREQLADGGSGGQAGRAHEPGRDLRAGGLDHDGSALALRRPSGPHRGHPCLHRGPGGGLPGPGLLTCPAVRQRRSRSEAPLDDAGERPEPHDPDRVPAARGRPHRPPGPRRDGENDLVAGDGHRGVASLGLLAQSAQKSLSQTLSVSAFPQAGQNAQQQSQDEAACYQWAVQNTGTDPFDLQKKAQAQQQQTAQAAGQAQAAGANAGVKGAAKGAAAGALIGAAAGDTGTGAAVGATVGAVAGRRKKKQAEAQAEAGAGAGCAGPAGHRGADGGLQEGLLCVPGRQEVHRQVLSHGNARLRWHVTPSGVRALEGDVVWNGSTYKAGVTVDGKFDNTYAYIGWHYDIFRAENVKVWAGLSVAYERFETGLRGEAQVTGPNGTITKSTVRNDFSVGLPAPLIGLGVSGAISRQWTFDFYTRAIGFSSTDVAGSVLEAGISFAWYPTKSFGVVGGADVNKINLRKYSRRDLILAAPGSRGGLFRSSSSRELADQPLPKRHQLLFFVSAPAERFHRGTRVEVPQHPCKRQRREPGVLLGGVAQPRLKIAPCVQQRLDVDQVAGF